MRQGEVRLSFLVRSGFMGAYLDILIYALVAGILFFWLFSILGKRTGYERNQEDDYGLPEQDPEIQDTKIIDWPKTPIAANEEVRQKIQKLKEIDPNFSEHHFMTGAKYAFETILSAFASGDLNTLKPLLDEPLFKSFKASIDSRSEHHEKQVTRLEKIKEIVISDAYYESSFCYVTVHYTSEQINVTYDQENRVLEGDPDHYVTLKDAWTFKRDPKSTGPEWLLVKTKSA